MSRRLRHIDKPALIKEWIAVITSIHNLMKEMAKNSEHTKMAGVPGKDKE